MAPKVRTKSTNQKVQKRVIHWTSSKLKTLLLQMTPSRKWKDKPEKKRKYVQMLRNLSLKDIKNTHNSIMKRPKKPNLKMGKGSEKTFLQRKNTNRQ